MITAILARVTVRGHSGYAQQVETAGHTLAVDEPVKRGGTDTGPSPMELLLAGLGTCTSITLRMYAERKQWLLGDIEVNVRLLKEGDNQRIERVITIAGPLDAAQGQRLLEIADKTPVTKIVAAGTTITSTIESGTSG